MDLIFITVGFAAMIFWLCVIGIFIWVVAKYIKYILGFALLGLITIFILLTFSFMVATL